MKGQYFQKSVVYNQAGVLLLLAGIAVNPLSLILLNRTGLIQYHPGEGEEYKDVVILFPLFLSAAILLISGTMIFVKRSVFYYINNKVWYNLLLFVLLALAFFTSNPVRTGHLVWLRLLFLLLTLFVWLNVLYLGVVKNREGEHHRMFHNLVLMLVSVVFIWLVLEGVFMFMSKTHSFNFTLASRRWHALHYHKNDRGYRDVNHPPPAQNDKTKRIFVLGDSFVAGHGIKNTRDRFGEQLGAMLSAPNTVYNLGLPGSDAHVQDTCLRNYGIVPDILITSWYPNDMQHVCEQAGREMPQAKMYSRVPTVMRSLFKRSYVLNYLYWRRGQPGILDTYKDFLRDCFADSLALNTMFRDMENIHQYALEHNVPQVMVVFPFMEMPEGSGFATAPVRAWCAERQIPVVMVEELVAGKQPGDLIINENDTHANEWVNRKIAEALREKLRPWID